MIFHALYLIAKEWLFYNLLFYDRIFPCSVFTYAGTLSGLSPTNYGQQQPVEPPGIANQGVSFFDLWVWDFGCACSKENAGPRKTGFLRVEKKVFGKAWPSLWFWSGHLGLLSGAGRHHCLSNHHHRHQKPIDVSWAASANKKIREECWLRGQASKV